MVEKNTLSILESIKKKMQKFDQKPKKSEIISGVNDEFEYEDDDFFEYCISNKEVPAFVRGLIKRSKTKKITLNKAMDEWFKENHRRFSNPDEEWPKVKKVWTDFANKMRSKEKVKKFK